MLAPVSRISKRPRLNLLKSNRVSLSSLSSSSLPIHYAQNSQRRLLNEAELSPCAIPSHAQCSSAPSTAADIVDKGDLQRIAQSLKGVDSNAGRAVGLMIRSAWQASLLTPQNISDSPPGKEPDRKHKKEGITPIVDTLRNILGIDSATQRIAEAVKVQAENEHKALAGRQRPRNHVVPSSSRPAFLEEHEQCAVSIDVWLDAKSMGLIGLSTLEGNLRDRIWLGLSAATAAVSGAACDFDVLYRILESLHADCQTAETSSSSRSGGAAAPAASGVYFSQSLKRICSLCSVSMWPSVVAAVAKIAVGRAKDGNEQEEEEGVDLLHTMACLGDMLKLGEGGSFGGTAKGAGGHIVTTMGEQLISVTGCINAVLELLLQASKTDNPQAFDLAIILIDLCELVASYSALIHVHTNVMQCFPNFLPPSARFRSDGDDNSVSGQTAGRESVSAMQLRSEQNNESSSEVDRMATYYCRLIKAVVSVARRNEVTAVIASSLVSPDDQVKIRNRHISPEGARLALDAIEVLSLVIETERTVAASPHMTRVVQKARDGLNASLATLAKTHPEYIIRLFEEKTVSANAAILDAYLALGKTDDALAVLTAIGESQSEGWSNPPPSIISSAQRLALLIGQCGLPRHLNALTRAVYSFKSPNLWMGVFLDFATAGLAARIQQHAEENSRAPAALTMEERKLQEDALDAYVYSFRDMIIALALQRSSDVSADPLLELLQECCWHPRAGPLIECVVEHHDHLFSCFPALFSNKVMNVPKEHRSRSKQFKTPNAEDLGGCHPMSVVGSFLKHSVLTFLRDNKQIQLVKTLSSAWSLPNKDVAKLLNRDADVAPNAQLWECRSCSKLNNARYMYCSCSALRFGSTVCPSCGLGQMETNSSCIACGNSLASLSSDYIVPRVPWTCSGCGGANSAYQTIFCCKCLTATGPLARAVIRTDSCGSCNAPNSLGESLYPVCVECGSVSEAFQKNSAKAWRCDSCGLWAPTSLTRCPHCPFVELRGDSPLRDIAPITCSSCGKLNRNGLQSHCEACDCVLEGNLPTTVDLCTECFSANTHGAHQCSACEVPFESRSENNSSMCTPTNHIVVKAFYRFCRSCNSSVSPYNLSCVCDRCDAFLPFYTTPSGEPILNASPDAVGVVSTCETILRRLDREGPSVMIPIAEGFLLELAEASRETIAVARPLLTDVVGHFGQLFSLDSIDGCRGLALTLAMAHLCACEITEGRLVELDKRVMTAYHNRQQEERRESSSGTLVEELSPIASFVAGSSSDATAHNTASLLFSSSVVHTSPSEADRMVDEVSDHEKYLNHHAHEHQQLCGNCLSPHPESMCRFNPAGWQCGGCGKTLSNGNGLDGVMCPSCYQVRPELENCLEVWQCPECNRCSPETELFCLYCNTHKETAALKRADGVFLLPFLPVTCGLCARPHLEVHCPYCTAIAPTRVRNGVGTVTSVTDRYVFVQPLGTCAADARIFVPIQLAGELFEGKQVSFDAEEGKPGQLKATRIEVIDN